MDSMLLKLLTPTGETACAECDSVVLTMADDSSGRSGGLIGIQRDHAPAVIALAPGPVRASLAGKEVLRAETSGGFASVKDNVVTVIADSAEISE